MDNWKKIWSLKNTDLTELDNLDFETIFMELKRLTGNDTTGKGVTFENLILRFRQFQEELLFCQSKTEKKSVFEVGCGSGANLLLFQKLGFEIGGIDYSKSLIEVANRCLKHPIELYCEEAEKLDTEIKYDIVFSNSAFEYFTDEKYARRVLGLMCKKAYSTVGVLEIHDSKLKDKFVEFRRETIKGYDEKYKDLKKLFLSREFFLNFAEENKLDIKFCYPKIEGYWNSDYIYDVYLYK